MLSPEERPEKSDKPDLSCRPDDAAL